MKGEQAQTNESFEHQLPRENCPEHDGVLEEAIAISTILSYYRAQAGRKRARHECLRLIAGEGPARIRAALQGLSPEWADHAIASVYAVLMPHDRRQMLGAYFTPPHLVLHLLQRMTSFGFDLSNATIRDPSAGGAAFLVPLARRMVSLWRHQGHSDRQIVRLLRQRLYGTEIDRGLTDIANALVRRMLVTEWGFRPSEVEGLSLVVRANALTSRKRIRCTQHEVGNPPYRRLSSSEHTMFRPRFSDICSSRLNLYTMFMRRGLDEVPPGGLVGHIVPASFLGGPEFATFRRRLLQIAEVLVVDVIDQRNNVFVDATQDACFVVLRRREKEIEAVETWASTGSLGTNGRFLAAAPMRCDPDGGVWYLPGHEVPLEATLADWGYKASVGYIVPFRQRDRLFERPAKGRYPLVWAKAIGQDGSFELSRGVSPTRFGWVSAPSDAPYIIREACVAVQRTSSRDQAHRVVAAAVPNDLVNLHGGLVGENHIIFLVRVNPEAPSPEALAAALNDPRVSQAMNRMCASASLSIGVLQQVPLPSPASCQNGTTPVEPLQGKRTKLANIFDLPSNQKSTKAKQSALL